MSLDLYLTFEVHTGGPCPHEITLYQGNITHNLAPMAHACGLYDPLWQPSLAFASQGKDVIQRLSAGIARMEAHPEKYKRMDPSNGWGSSEVLLRFAKDYLDACMAHPKARIRISS